MKRFNLKVKFRNKLFIFSAIILVITIVFVYFFESRAKPVIIEVACSQAENAVNTAIEDAITRVLDENEFTYSSLVQMDKDSMGRIVAVRADTMRMNVLKSKISNAVSEEVSEMDSKEIQIPMGTIIGISTLSGKGPDIKTNVTVSVNVNLRIDNKFTSAGINQTLHEIIVCVDATVFVIMPRKSTTAKIETNFCIAQTVIIGTVPETFAEFGKQGETNNE